MFMLLFALIVLAVAYWQPSTYDPIINLVVQATPLERFWMIMALIGLIYLRKIAINTRPSATPFAAKVQVNLHRMARPIYTHARTARHGLNNVRFGNGAKSTAMQSDIDPWRRQRRIVEPLPGDDSLPRDDASSS